MKAYRFYAPNQPLKLEEVPIPKMGPEDVLVKIKASGICGTDVNYKLGKMLPYKTPLITGHEIAGVIEEVGENVKYLKEGDRVVIHYILSCGRCTHCDQGFDNRCRNRKSIGAHVDGGFAEYIVVPARNAFILPNNISFEEGAIIGCAVSTPFHALRLGGFRPGDVVVVYGLGGVGMHGIAWARALGASIVIGVDILDYKLRLAKEFGADIVINPKEENPVKVIRDVTDGYGADLVLECAGAKETVKAAIESVKGKSRYESGRVVIVAHPPGPIEVTSLREGALYFSGDHTRDELRRIIQLVKNRRIDLSKSITHRLPFSELNRAIDLLAEKRENVLKVVVVQ